MDDCSRNIPTLELLYDMHGGCAEPHLPIEPKIEPENEQDGSKKRKVA
ncbi:hypothetical protein SOVF_070020, partial [Spinacia oleracea]